MKIRKLIAQIIKEFRLERYLKKPKRETVEKFNPKLISDPSFMLAAELDNNGKWKEAANHYYSIFTKSTSAHERGEAYFLLGQMYMNLVRYNLARKFLLDNKSNILSALSGWDKTYCEARIFEKLGWINDYFGEIREGIKNFSQARKLLSRKSKTDYTVLRIYETSNHFLGRLYAISAWQDIDPKKNVKLAVERFRESIDIYRKLARSGKSDKVSLGFQYAWMARMHMLSGKLQETSKDLNMVKRLFSNAIKSRPGSGVLGYYYLLLGRFNIEKGNYTKAKKDFAEALRINTEVVKYSSSQADAIFGMAICDFANGKKDEARKEVSKALSLNPSLLYRGYI